MVNPIPEAIRRVWEHWNTRGTVMLSLGLQICLILLAPLRKRTANKFIMFFIWSSYLLADAVANFGIGLISNSQSDRSGSTDSPENSDLLAFWTPLLLVHLGGPDTITAFSYADNELWIRHLLTLLIQVVATGYVFIQTLPNNKVMIPTILMFVAGVIKYLERTCSLYLASVDGFRDYVLKQEVIDPGPNYVKLMEVFASVKEANLPTQTVSMEPDTPKIGSTEEQSPKSHSEEEVIQSAFRSFKVFKKLVADLTFSFEDRAEARRRLNKMSAKDAFEVIEVELNFLYEVLFTKALVVYSKWGMFFRFVATSCVLAALGIFRFHVKKHGRFDEFDVGITYALLLGAVILDMFAFFIAIFSDWTNATLQDYRTEARPVLRDFIRHRLPAMMVKANFISKRWSRSVSGYSLIDYCLRKRPYKKQRSVDGKTNGCTGKRMQNLVNYIYSKVQHKLWGGSLDEIFYVSKNHVIPDDDDDHLWTFIFDELKQKSDQTEDNPETGKRIYAARGDWVLQYQYDTYLEVNSDSLLPYILEVDYDESVLLWHVATDLLYNIETPDTDDEIWDMESPRHLSKILSDYMLYLMIRQPSLMAAVAGIVKLRVRDTCNEARSLFQSTSSITVKKFACKNILKVPTLYKPVQVKGDRNKSALFAGSMLAKELSKLEEKKWEIISKVWVELLSYAASHCRPHAHAQQVSKGGEIISFVWLLMAQFGIGDKFQISEGQVRVPDK